MTEAQLQSAVTDLCTYYGLFWYHPYDSRRSVPGYPDLTIVGTRVIFRELKSSTGRMRPVQLEWAARLTKAGADVDVWRPDDLRTGRIQAELMLIR